MPPMAALVVRRANTSLGQCSSSTMRQRATRKTSGEPGRQSRIVRARYGGERHSVQRVSGWEGELIERTERCRYGAGLNTVCLLPLYDLAQHHLEIVEYVVPVDALGACARLHAQ